MAHPDTVGKSEGGEGGFVEKEGKFKSSKAGILGARK